jgi:hypothetical protein
LTTSQAEQGGAQLPFLTGELDLVVFQFQALAIERRWVWDSEAFVDERLLHLGLFALQLQTFLHQRQLLLIGNPRVVRAKGQTGGNVSLPYGLVPQKVSLQSRCGLRRFMPLFRFA